MGNFILFLSDENDTHTWVSISNVGTVAKKKIRKFKKEKGENEQKNEIFIREKNLRVSFFFLLFLGVVRYENGNLYGMWQVKSKREGWMGADRMRLYLWMCVVCMLFSFILFMLLFHQNNFYFLSVENSLNFSKKLFQENFKNKLFFNSAFDAPPTILNYSSFSSFESAFESLKMNKKLFLCSSSHLSRTMFRKEMKETHKNRTRNIRKIYRKKNTFHISLEAWKSPLEQRIFVKNIFSVCVMLFAFSTRHSKIS